MERRFAAILAADVLGYSRLMEADILMRDTPSSSMQSFIESGHGGHETDLLCLGAQAFKFRHQFCPAPTLPPRCQRPAAGDHVASETCRWPIAFRISEMVAGAP